MWSAHHLLGIAPVGGPRFRSAYYCAQKRSFLHKACAWPLDMAIRVAPVTNEVIEIDISIVSKVTLVAHDFIFREPSKS